jgi:Flp pilus assembly protein TadG
MNIFAAFVRYICHRMRAKALVWLASLIQVSSFLFLLKGFAKSTQGNIFVSTAVALPVLVMAVGGAVDYGMVANQKSRLQQAVDAAAIATAREMSLSDANTTRLTAVAETVVSFNLAEEAGEKAAGSTKVAVKVDQNEQEVVVNAEQSVEQMFGGFLVDVSSISVFAQAKVVGTARVCVIGLQERGAGTIALNHSAIL